MFFSDENGLSLIETLLSVAIFSFISLGVVGVLAYGSQSTLVSAKRIDAQNIAQEGLAAVRDIRDDAFIYLYDGTYGLDDSSGSWELVDSPDTVNGYTRTVTITTVDAYTKSVSVTVDWQQNIQRTGSITLVTHLGNWKGRNQPPPDVTPPAAVTDLVAQNPTVSSVDLTWTAPGDDGNTGVAQTYDVRYSTSPITESNWSSATLVSGEPVPSIPGSSESMTVSGLSSNTTYYFAIKTIDDSNNESAISNSPSATTPIAAADALVFDDSAASRTNGNTAYTGFELENTSGSTISIVEVKITWSGGKATALNGIEFDNSWVYGPSGSAPSGSVIDITDTSLGSGYSTLQNTLDFDDRINGSTMDITFYMGDGSIKEVLGVKP